MGLAQGLAPDSTRLTQMAAAPLMSVAPLNISAIVIELRRPGIPRDIPRQTAFLAPPTLRITIQVLEALRASRRRKIQVFGRRGGGDPKRPWRQRKTTARRRRVDETGTRRTCHTPPRCGCVGIPHLQVGEEVNWRHPLNHPLRHPFARHRLPGPDRHGGILSGFGDVSLPGDGLLGFLQQLRGGSDQPASFQHRR